MDNIYCFWLLLALPALPMLIAAYSGEQFGKLLHPTGEFSARFMIIAMMISPLMLIFPGSPVLKWLLVRRRALGVASCCYAAAHTLLYLIIMSNLEIVLNQLLTFSIWTGWLAFVILIPMAATSNPYMVKRLKSRWKRLQRWVYAAAVLTLLHWIFVRDSIGSALVHFLPLALLEVFRIITHFRRKREPSLFRS